MPKAKANPAAFPGMYLATESFSGAFADGGAFNVVKFQTRVTSLDDHGLELLERYGKWFEPIVAHYGVEAATAAPGEERE